MLLAHAWRPAPYPLAAKCRKDVLLVHGHFSGSTDWTEPPLSGRSGKPYKPEASLHLLCWKASGPQRTRYERIIAFVVGCRKHFIGVLVRTPCLTGEDEVSLCRHLVTNTSIASIATALTLRLRNYVPYQATKGCCEYLFDRSACLWPIHCQRLSHLVPSAMATGLRGETFFGLQVSNIQHTVRCLPDWPGQARPNQRRALAIRTFLLHTTR